MTDEDRRNMISTNAWEQWTQNGLGLDDEDRELTGKSATDAATDAYQDGMSDLEWLAATVALLTRNA